LRDEQGQITGYIAFLTDLTELKLTQEELQKAERRYRGMYQNAVQGMFQCTLAGRILRVNPAYARILGYSSPEEMLSRVRLTTEFYDDPADQVKMIEALKEKGVLTDYELKLKRHDGAAVWVLVNVRLKQEDEDHPIIEGLLVDNTARKRAERKLRRSREKFRGLAVRDNLTGLYNTRQLYQALGDLIAASRGNGNPFSLIFMDMDNFKRVVDTYGHLNGSQALKEVAATIRQSLSAPAFAVAYGGDEFVVVLPGFDKHRAKQKADEIRSRMQATAYLSERGYAVCLRASFGVATYPDDAADRSGLLALADQAMFHVKQSGKDAVGLSLKAGPRILRDF
ncbi:MAG: GGDEF domain-containing protein, partial [Desulfobacterales bacterium]